MTIITKIISCRRSIWGLLSTIVLLSTFLAGQSSFGQTSVQNFGTTAGSNTSQTASTTLIPTPTGTGTITTYARAGATAPAAPIALATTSNPLGTTGAYMKATASATTSVAKASPIVGYSGSTQFYTSFKILFGDTSGGNTATSGSWTFSQGPTIAFYSDNNQYASANTFTGLRFTYGASGALTLSYDNSGTSTFTTTGLTTSAFSQGTVYTIEIVGNNGTSTLSYNYSGVAQTTAVQTYDLFINGTRIGNDLAYANCTTNTNITSMAFTGISSTSNVANIFVDDVTVYNAVPANIGVSTFTSTATGGLWNATGSWVGGVVPSAGSTVNIVGPITINNTTGQISNTGIININNSGTLLCGYTSGASLTGTGTVNVNGTGILDIEQGGWPGTTNSFNYGNVTAGTGTLKFNNSSGSYGVNATDTWFPSTITNVNVAGAGGITLNSAHTISGSFQSSATVVNPGNITANGTLQLNSGYGWSGTGSPIYGSSSLLQYNSGGSPGRSIEWNQASGTIGTTAGYPNNVQVSNNTTLNFANGGTLTYKANGTLTVDSGSSLYQNYSGGNAGLAVVSDVTINGNITLGTSSGDLYVGGNLTVGSAANFSSNGRAVFFNGTGTQTIAKTAGGTVAFDYFIIDKTAGSVVLSSSPATDVTVNASSGNVLQLINTGGLDLNGRTMTFNNSGGAIYVNGARTISSAVAGGSLAFTNYKVVANNAGTGSLSLAANVVVNLNTNGNVDFGKSGATYITTLLGTLSINSTTSCFVNTNPPIYGAASLLKYNSGGTYGRGAEWSATSGAGYPNDVQVSNSTTLNYPNTGTGAFSTNLSIARDLTVDTASSLYMDYGTGGNKSGALTIGRNISLSGNLSLGDAVGGDLNVAGNWSLSGGTFTPNLRAVQFNGTGAQTITGATTFDYLTLNNSTGLTLSNSVVVNKTLALTSGKITIGTNDLTVGSTGTITGATTSNYVVTASTGQLKRTVGASPTLFAVGNTAYNPITFNNSGTSDVYGVRVANTAPAGANSTKTITRQWITTEAVGGGSNLSVVAQYNTGETGAGFAAGTDYFIGQYNGTSWIQAPATQAGSNPFTVTTSSNLSPTNMTTGTQYFAIGRDNGLISAPTKYVLSAITPSSPTAGSGFSVTVTAQDNYGATTTLSSSSTFALTSNGNAGAISGTTTGTIASGNSSVTVSGIILASAGTGVTLTATNTSGVSLTAGTSATFTVLAAANQLAFVGVPSTGNVGVNLTSFTVEARRPDTTVDNTYTGNITISKASGTGNLSGTLTVAAVAGVATFSTAQFDAASTYTLSATSGSLTAATSGNIVVTLAPTVIAQFDYTTSPYVNYTAKNANVSVTDTALSAGTISTNVTSGSNFPNPPYVAGTGGWTTTTQTGAKNFNFTITANTGYQIEVTSLQFNALATTAGPSAISFDIANGTSTYTTNAPDTALVTVNQTTTGLTNLTTVPVLIQGWLNGSRTSAGSGNLRLDDVIVKGYVTCKTPATFTVGGGGAFCSGGTGVNVTLSGSESIMSYQLKRNGTNVGSAIAGTGSALNFGLQTTAGTYTVVATNANGGCNLSQTMTGSATVTINPLPTATIGGTTTVCRNATAPTITFTGANGTAPYTFTYTLNGSSNQTISTTSGNSVTLAAPTTTAGTFTYTLVSVADANCSQTQSGSAVVTVNSQPTATISGTTSVCLNSTSPNITFTGANGTAPYTFTYTLNGSSNQTISTTSGNSVTLAAPTTTAGTFTYTLVSVADANCSQTQSGSAVVTVNAKPTATISGTTTVCRNATAPTITFTGANGTAPYTFTYTLNGSSNQTISTTSGNSVTLAAPTTTAGTFTYTLVSVADANCSQAQSGSAVVTVQASPTASVLSGGATICAGSSTNLQVAITGGASPYTVVYSGGTVSSYVSGTNIPVSPSSTTTYTLTSVTDANGCAGTGNSGSATVTLNSTTTTDGGATWSNGAPTASTSVVFDGATGTVSSNLSGCSLRLTNNATVTVASGNNVTLSGSLTVDSGSSFTLSNNANLLQTGTGSNSGNIVVKRNSAALKRLDYTLWSSPVSGQALYAFSPFTFANRFYIYNPSTDLYAAAGLNVTGTNADGVNGTDGNNVQFAAATGYLIRVPWDHPTSPTIWTGTFTGVPNNGTITRSGLTSGLFYAIGNPYPSTISADQFIADNSIGNNALTPGDGLYFWRKTNNAAASSYATYTTAGGVKSGGDTLNIVPNGVIQVGEGFIVKSPSSSLTFNNGQRIANNADQFLRTASPIERNRIWLNLSDSNNVIVNQMMVAYMTGATQGVDAAIDGRYFNDNQTALNSFLNNEEFAIQGRSLPFDSADVVPLAFKSASAGNFSIGLENTDGLFAGGAQPIYLKDNQTNTVHDLSTGAYVFATTAGTFNNRFELVYQTQLGTGHTTFNSNNVIIYNQNADFVINTGNIIMSSVKVFDIRGRLIQERKGINASQTTINVGLANEVLLVQITSQDGIVVTKKVIR